MLYLVVTRWAYPFGGGEAWMYQTMQFASGMGWESLWLSFSSKDNKYHRKLALRNPGLLDVPGPFTEEILRSWLILLRPDVVHTQGPGRLDIVSVCRSLNVPVIVGYHFWHGALILNTVTQNTKIMTNPQTPDPELKQVLESADEVYVASEFMHECVRKFAGQDLPVLCPMPSKQRAHVLSPNSFLEPIFVSMLNLHHLKGGQVFLALCRDSSLPLYGIQSEPGSESLDIEIAACLRPDSVLSPYRHDVTSIYAVTRILLAPSLVDETFGMVLAEAMMNGIPVICARAGNLPFLAGNCSGIIVMECPDSEKITNAWVRKTKTLYRSGSKLRLMSVACRKRFELLNKQYQSEEIFREMLLRCGSGFRPVLFAPWGDQGLGIQCRNYVRAIVQSGYEVIVLSFKSYYVEKQEHTNSVQASTAEWDPPTGCTVIYSQMTREKIKDQEVLDIFRHHRVTHFIIPETCWNRVFELARLAGTNNVIPVAIPNIEIVRRDELYQHRSFRKILCNNRLGEAHFTREGFGPALSYIGYSIAPVPSLNIQLDGNPGSVRFLCIGGMNAFHRKQVDKVLEAWNVFKNRFEPGSCSLTITIQDQEADISILNRDPKPDVTVIQNLLSSNEIVHLYRSHDVVIQVSRQEGLGLGFYEPLYHSKPVITLDTAPHNEIIRDGVNGWLIPCTYEPMNDNNDALFGSAVFDVANMASVLLKAENLLKSPEGVSEMEKKIRMDWQDRFDWEEFRKRFMESLISAGT